MSGQKTPYRKAPYATAQQYHEAVNKKRELKDREYEEKKRSETIGETSVRLFDDLLKPGPRVPIRTANSPVEPSLRIEPPPAPAPSRSPFLQGWDQLRKQPPEVQAAEQARYNALAKRSALANDPAVFKSRDEAYNRMEADDLGRTYVRYPESKIALDKLISERIHGPFLPGKSPYNEAVPQTAVATRPGPREEEAIFHENRHVERAQPGERGDSPEGREWRSLGPRERELWRIYKSLRNEENPHEFHRPGQKRESGPSRDRYKAPE